MVISGIVCMYVWTHESSDVKKLALSSLHKSWTNVTNYRRQIHASIVPTAGHCTGFKLHFFPGWVGVGSGGRGEVGERGRGVDASVLGGRK